jgi:NAD(P)-dependent dehydrogenase (short-subunit alcohol dehydrogenase family)
MPLVTGKTALVTGAAAGIGRATALAFAAEGARVLVSDIDLAGTEETARLIAAAGGTAIAMQVDVSRPAELQAMVDRCMAEWGRLDIACNNAGIEGRIAPLADQTEADVDRVWAVNLRGTWAAMRAEIPAMLKGGGGSIVNLASVAGLIGFAGLSPYVASKHAVNGLTKTAALEYGKQGIRVNAVCPGGIDTRMLDSLAEQISGGAQDSRQVLDPLHPIGRIGTPQEVADLIVWLASDRAGFVTGACIPVDGAFTAQ